MPKRKPPSKDYVERVERRNERQERHAAILADIEAGKLTYDEISDKHEVSQSQVSRIAIKHGHVRDQGRPRSSPPVVPSEFRIERAPPPIAAPMPSGFPWAKMNPGDSVFVPRMKAAPVLAELPDHPGFASEVEDSGIRIRRNA